MEFCNQISIIPGNFIAPGNLIADGLLQPINRHRAFQKRIVIHLRVIILLCSGSSLDKTNLTIGKPKLCILPSPVLWRIVIHL